MSELEYNTPLYDRDKRYCQCENCDGTGTVYGHDGDLPYKESCDKCDGSGVLEIED